jgi:hypothetical protein
MSHPALLQMACRVRRRTDVVDDNGDVVTTDTEIGSWPCHAYQFFANEETDRKVIGREDVIVHLPPEADVETGDRLDIIWPSRGRTIEAEVIAPPAYRVNARTGLVHHIEARSREVR